LLAEEDDDVDDNDGDGFLAEEEGAVDTPFRWFFFF
jgi:hypothetical protein